MESVLKGVAARVHGVPRLTNREADWRCDGNSESSQKHLTNKQGVRDDEALGQRFQEHYSPEQQEYTETSLSNSWACLF